MVESSAGSQHLSTDDLDKLLEILPETLRRPLQAHPQRDRLVEVVMDLDGNRKPAFPESPSTYPPI
jgi:stage III sporulation protein SpoIIIAA